MFVTLLLDGKFPLGRIEVTSKAHDALSQADVTGALLRHAEADWGELEEEDWKQNDDAMLFGGRLLSQYSSQAGTKFWIITEHDRSATTVLLPEEY